MMNSPNMNNPSLPMDSNTHAIAIVGMAGRFPRARSLAEFWDNLCRGVECVQPFTEEEILAAGVDPVLLRNPHYVRAGAFLEDAEYFDAAFFGISRREAELLDPQHRVFLECAWEALESAGYDPSRYDGSIGVYAGVSMNSYLFANLLKNPALLASMGGYQTMLANDKDFLPTRVSYKLNLRGPSMAIQTACSTSLVAFQVACQALLARQCDMALSGAVSLSFPQKTGYLYQEGMILSPDGHCRPFDEKAAGIFSGTGAGIVVLKRLEEAIADRDLVYAVVKGAAINNDGSAKIGYTAPAIDGQAAAIRMAQEMAGVNPETITYVEAHGTGTPLGDPIEIAALTKAFREKTDKSGFCAIGSLKGNIGHLDVAAGVAGLIKTALALRHGKLPPSLHFENPNPKIDFASSPFYVQKELADWTSDGPRRAAVSSFGIGGTNAHAILEEAPARTAGSSSRPWQLLVLSARNPNGLETAKRNLAGQLRGEPDADLADIAYTLQSGRKVFEHRWAAVVQDTAGALAALESREQQRVFASTQESVSRPVVFMFTGQGSQYLNMGATLYRVEPVFRRIVDECAEAMIPEVGIDLRDLICPQLRADARKDDSDIAADLLDQTRYAQPALFIVEYALAQLWMSWGIRPEAMIGHSIGEYTAACIAGVFSLEGALKLVAARGRLMQELPSGSMLAVFASEADIRPYLNQQISLAAVNSPALCTLSGPSPAIQDLARKLTASGVECKRLHTSHAFHSWMMEPILGRFASLVESFAPKAPRIPIVSNLTGKRLTDAEATNPAYWAQHLRGTVRFADGLKEAFQENRIFVEIGPGQTLATFAKQSFERGAAPDVYASLPAAQNRGAEDFLTLTLSRMWLAGARVDWSGFYAHEQRNRVALPTYPFERERFWPEPPKAQAEKAPRETGPARRADFNDWFYKPVWREQPLASAPKTGGTGVCLIFQDSRGIGAAIAERMRARQKTAICVLAGSSFLKSGPASFTIDPSRKDHYGMLCGELAQAGMAPDTVVHLWSLADAGAEAGGSSKTILDRSFYSLLYLAQSLDERRMTAPVDILAAADRLYSVWEEQVSSPLAGVMAGLMKVLPQEYPNLRTRTVDVLPGSAQAVSHLVREMAAGDGAVSVAYRGNRRWVQDFTPFAPESDGTSRLRSGGVYLITGGLGEIGFRLAHRLAEKWRARLVLVSRTAAPPRNAWSGWLETHEASDATSVLITRIQMLEAAGAEVLVVNADVADAAALRGAWSQARQRFGTIHGVFHAAGIVTGAPLAETDKALCEKLFQAKVYGLLALAEVIQDEALDFCVLLSSLSSILGGLGFAAYAGSNLFMDAFAQRRNQDGGFPWLTINFDAFHFSGPAAGDSARHAAAAAAAMTGDEGLDVFERLLASDFSGQAVISLTSLERRLNDWIYLDRGIFDAAPDWDSAASAGASASKPLALEIDQFKDDFELRLASIWADLLGTAALGPDDDFFELGGHSLLATRVLARVQDVFKVRLPLRSFFETPTVRGLAVQLQMLSWSQQGAEVVAAESHGDREEFEL